MNCLKLIFCLDTSLTPFLFDSSGYSGPLKRGTKSCVFCFTFFLSFLPLKPGLFFSFYFYFHYYLSPLLFSFCLSPHIHISSFSVLKTTTHHLFFLTCSFKMLEASEKTTAFYFQQNLWVPGTGTGKLPSHGVHSGVLTLCACTERAAVNPQKLFENHLEVLK